MDTLYFVYYSSIFVQVLSLIIVSLFVIPLQLKEASVKNGLKKLRVQLLISGATIGFLSLVTILVLGLRFITVPLNVSTDVSRSIIIFLVLIHSLGFLVLAINKLIMYKTQYTEKAKEAHKLIEESQEPGKCLKISKSKR